MYTYNATVDNVVDGDTIDVTVDLGLQIYSKQRIRLLGIDTPERGQPGFVEAGEFLRGMILGKTITLKTHRLSKFGQYLGEVWLLDTNVNQTLVSSGHAKVFLR